MNPSQQRAWDELSPRWVVKVPQGPRSTSIAPDAPPLDFTEVFGREAPVHVEVGIGDGATIAHVAEQHPEINFLGFEVFLPTTASALGRCKRAGVENVRIVVADAEQAFEQIIPPSSVTEVWTFFPDPWHKKRHHKRRIINPRFAASVAKALIQGGRWRIATDWEDYAEWIAGVMDGIPELVDEFPEGAPRWNLRPITRFEQRALNAGRKVADMVYVKR
jgi:tRNA (guanine-N7-)-methyltransferase